MALLAFLFRAILFLFAVRLAGIVLRVFLGGFMQGARPNDPSGPGRIEELVKDPVCGVHTARSTAIAGRYQGTPAYFCSENCAEKARAAS
jgi:YHS domain-containing protein